MQNCYLEWSPLCVYAMNPSQYRAGRRFSKKDEQWMIIWFTLHRTTTLPKWMFFQKLFFKSSLMLISQCGIHFRPPNSSDDLCFLFCLYPPSMPTILPRRPQMLPLGTLMLKFFMTLTRLESLPKLLQPPLTSMARSSRLLFSSKQKSIEVSGGQGRSNTEKRGRS